MKIPRYHPAKWEWSTPDDRWYSSRGPTSPGADPSRYRRYKLPVNVIMLFYEYVHFQGLMVERGQRKSVTINRCQKYHEKNDGGTPTEGTHSGCILRFANLVVRCGTPRNKISSKRLPKYLSFCARSKR